MPRCWMATLATMKEIAEEGGRHERGVSRSRGLPRNPSPQASSFLGQSLPSTGSSQGPNSQLQLASLTVCMVARKPARSRGHQLVQTFHRTDIDTPPPSSVSIVTNQANILFVIKYLRVTIVFKNGLVYTFWKGVKPITNYETNFLT